MVKGVEHWKDEAVSLIKLDRTLPDPFLKAVSAQFYIDGRNKEIDLDKRMYSLHLPILGMGVTWIVMALFIGRGGLFV